MQGQPNHGHAYCRCRFPSEYAATADLDHLKTVYVQEGPMAAAVDRWLGRLFDADHIDETCRLLAGAGEIDEAAAARAEAAIKAVIDCDARLAKYRATLKRAKTPRRRALDTQSRGSAPGCRAHPRRIKPQRAAPHRQPDQDDGR